MLWKFLKASGEPKTAVRYLLDKRERNGQLRHRVRILAGSADAFIAVTAACPHKHKYKSFVMGWADEEAPSITEIRAEIRRWEQVAFAGLEPDQYTYFAVMHESAAGGHDVHILIPRVEMRSGRSLNIHPPTKAAERAFTLAQDAANAARGWASPSDPTRARLVRPTSPAVFEDAALIRAGMQPGRRPESQITDWLVRGIRAGHVRNRADVVISLAKLGTVTREGTDYVSVKLSGRERALRLRGLVYESDFSPELILARLSGPDGVAERSSGWRGGKRDPAAADRFAEELRPLVEKRAAYNHSRYGSPAVVALDADDSSDRALGRAATRSGLYPSKPAQRPQPSAPALRRSRNSVESNDDRHGRPPAKPKTGDHIGAGLVDSRPSESPLHAADRFGPALPVDSSYVLRHSWHDLVVDAQRSRRGASGARQADCADTSADNGVLRKRRGPEVLSPGRRRWRGDTERYQITTELDEHLAQALQRAGRTTFAFTHQPKEDAVAITQMISAIPTEPTIGMPKRSLREALQLPLKKTAVDAAPTSAAVSSGVDTNLEQLTTHSGGCPFAAISDVGFIGRVIQFFKNLLERIFGVVSVPHQAPNAVEQEDQRDLLIAQLRTELAATRAELAKLRAAASALGFDLASADQADDAVCRAIDAGARALEFDIARVRAGQRGEHDAMAAAQRNAEVALAEIHEAAADVERAATEQARRDGKEVSAAEAARVASDLDSKDPARAEELRQAWLILDRKIRAAHARIAEELRHPPLTEPEGSLPTYQAAQVTLTEEHRAALKQSRLERESQLASWVDERRAIEREMWPEQDLDDREDDAEREHQ